MADSFAVYTHVMRCLPRILMMLIPVTIFVTFSFFSTSIITCLDMFAQGEERIKLASHIIPQPLKRYNLIISGCSLNCVLAFAVNFISGS